MENNRTRFYILNRTGGLIVSVLASSVVDRVFEPRLDQIKSNIMKLVCVASPLSTQVLRRKNKDWLVRNQDNVSKRSYISTSGLLSQ